MIKYCLFLFYSMFLNVTLFANNTVLLSDSSKISLLTCSPGNDLYSAFGHSAIRVNDFYQGMDITFSYGAYDFIQSNFLYNFFKGQLTFMVVIEMTNDFLYAYKSEGREITEVILNLNHQQKQQLFNFLLWNAEVENRNYEYRFFTNNCATKIRDVLEQLPDRNIKFNYQLSGFEPILTMREILNKHLQQLPWVKLTVNLLLGYEYDKIPKPYEQIFLPHYLQLSVLNARNSNVSLSNKKIKILSKNDDINETQNILKTPELIIPIALVLIFYLLYVKGGSFIVSFVLTFSLIAGLIGGIVLWLQYVLRLPFWNTNLLWSIVGFIVFVCLLYFKNNITMTRNIIKFYGIYLTLLIFLLLVLPQTIPFVVTISLLLSGLFLIKCSTILKQDEFNK